MRETRLWIISLGSAALIIVLLGLHFAIMHYAPVFTGRTIEEVRSFQMMLERGRSVAQFVVYILFLAVALYHGLYSLRGILSELPVARGRNRLISRGLLLIGLVFFAYGTYVTWWTMTVK
jgi:succinate dehydrogenase hydrophobic anchor subunit